MGSSAARAANGKRLTTDNRRAGAFGPVRGYRSFLRNSVTGFALSAVLAGGAFAQCRDDRVELRGDWGRAGFTVEIADDSGERAQGLMYRDAMSSGAGMLFIYPRPQAAIAFWMRNTRIPLDIIYMDAQGVVQSIAHDAVPFDETPLPGGAGIQYVLEINGGLARRLGIAPGTQLRHPAITTPAWSCDE